MTQPQMTPPNDGAVPTTAPAPTDAERAALTEQVKGTALSGQVPDAQPAPVVTGAVTPPQPVVADPPPAPTDSQVVNEVAADEPPTDPSTEVAISDDGNVVALADKFDIATTGEVWPHDTLEFKGDTLGIRLPTRQALAAFSLASSKYVSLNVKNDLTGLFIARHLSPESYGRVFSRLMDPDEDDYDVETVGELFNAIVMAAVDADKADDAG